MSEENTNTETPSIMSGQNQADQSKGGIMDAFDRHFDDAGQALGDTATQIQSEAEEALGGMETQPEATEAASSQPEPKEGETPEPKEESKPDDSELVIDETFFGEEEDKPAEEEKPAEGFDEKAFDADTEKMIKALEEKGHPGDVYKDLRAKLKEAQMKTTSPEVEAEMEALKLKAEETEGLRARIEELSNKSAQLRVESSDEYLKEVIKPAENIFAKAEELAAQYSGDAAIIKAIIREKDRKTQNEMISEQLGDLSDFDRNEVYRMIQDFGKLVDKRDNMLEDAESKIDEIEARRIDQERAEKEEFRRNVQKIQQDIWERYEDKIPGLLDENGEPTPILQKLKSTAMSIDFSKAKGRDQAYASFAGVVLPHLASENTRMRKELAEYRADDARKVRQSTSAGKSIAPTPGSAKKEPEGLLARMENMDFA